MNSTQLLYAMALQAVPNIGDITAKKLIQHCGTPEAVSKPANGVLNAFMAWNPTQLKRYKTPKP
jgi:DNA processing protein